MTNLNFIIKVLLNVYDNEMGEKIPSRLRRVSNISHVPYYKTLKECKAKGFIIKKGKYLLITEEGKKVKNMFLELKKMKLVE